MSTPEVLQITPGVQRLTSEQIRAARALLRWEQRQLAQAAGVSVETVKRIEKRPGRVSAQFATVDAIRRAFEAAGVEFTNDDAPGVRLRRCSDDNR